MNGDPSAATLISPTTTIRGVVAVTGTGIIGSPVTFESTAGVSVPTHQDVLRLTGSGVTFAGGSYTGSGRIVPNGDVTVSADTTVDVGTYDLDGRVGNVRTTVMPGVRLTLNVNQTEKLDTPAIDTLGFNGTINLASGTLEVNNAGGEAWNMNGQLNFNQNSGQAAPLLAGSPVIVGGDVSVVGGTGTAEARINAPVQFTSGADLALISPNYTLYLNGDTVLDGVSLGSLSGAQPDLGAVVQNGNLTVQGNSTVEVGTYDWDGASNTSQSTIGPAASLTINATRMDTVGTGNTYRGTVTIQGGSLAVNATAASNWELQGTMNLTQSGIHRPSVSGIDLVVSGGTINVNGSAAIDVPTKLSFDAHVNVPDFGDTLEFNGPVVYDLATLSGSGRIDQNAAVTVSDDTTIDVGIYNWDGTTTGTKTTRLERGKKLTIRASQIDTGDPTSNGFDGVINLDGALLDVAAGASWLMDGALNLTETSSYIPRLTTDSGSPSTMVVRGTMTVSGMAYVDAPLELRSSANVTLTNATDLLHLGGPTTYNAVTITGNGTIFQNGAATIQGPGTTRLTLGAYDMDGATETGSITIDTGDLVIDAPQIDFDNRFNGTLSIGPQRSLEVLTSSPWEIAGTLDLAGNPLGAPGTITRLHGAPVTVSGRINASGHSIVSAPVTLTGQIGTADAATVVDLYSTGLHRIEGGVISGPGRLWLQPAAALHGYGVIDTRIDMAPSANLRAGGGTLTLTNPSLNVGVIGTENDTGVLEVIHPWRIPLASALEVVGGTVSGGQITNDDSTSGYGLIESDFLNNGTVHGQGPAPTDALTFSGNVSGAGSFTGNVVFTGTYSPGNSPATVHLENVAFADTATLILEIGGTDPAAYDRLIIEGQAELGGRLRLELIDGFVPSPGDRFELLQASNLTGSFAELPAGTGIPYLSSLDNGRLGLSVALPGDINLDGAVTMLDAALLTPHLGRAVGSNWTTGDFNFDGATTLADLDLMQKNLGRSLATNSTPAFDANAVPEPASWVFSLLGAIIVTAAARRRHSVLG